jgi:GH15 family glucan-1,4-alpha-glucosidase
VRVGNAAYQQLQIDVFGEVSDALAQARKAGMEITERGRAMRPLVIDHLARAWREPDEGIWEVRGGPQHFVHSKVMAWVSFDRAASEVAAEGLNEEARRWREIADQIHAEVCERGFDRELNTFVQAYGSKRLDASLLLIPLVGFLPASDPRIRGTLQAIEEKLLINRESCCATRPRTSPMAFLRAKERFSHAASGSSTTTYCRPATRKPESCSIVCSRAAMMSVCFPRSSTR